MLRYKMTLSLREPSKFCCVLKNFIKLVHPSALDPKGILMLNSIREIFDLLGIDFESMQFVSEKIEKNSIIDAINNQRKCPAIVTAMYDFPKRKFYNGHIMVAAGVKTETVQHGSLSKQE